MTGRIAVEWSSPLRNVPMTLWKENFERQQDSNTMTLTQSRCYAKIHSAAMSQLFIRHGWAQIYADGCGRSSWASVFFRVIRGSFIELLVRAKRCCR